jgi:hypothetical protein
MTQTLKHHYGTTEGPLGFPMKERAARSLERILRALPKTEDYQYRHLVLGKGPTELDPDERSDVSWISTEAVDRAGEVVRAKGLDDSHFQANPVVTWQHAYHLPPVGRSLWRKRAREGKIPGIKAKTQYPPCPSSWPGNEAWPADQAFALVQAGLLNGKSIGFVPTKVHIPDEREARQQGWDEVTLVIDEWILLEYACCFLPVNQDALVEAVSKGLPVSPAFLAQVGLEVSPAKPTAPAQVIPFTSTTEIARHVQRKLKEFNPDQLLQQALTEGMERARGRV